MNGPCWLCSHRLSYVVVLNDVSFAVGVSHKPAWIAKDIIASALSYLQQNELLVYMFVAYAVGFALQMYNIPTQLCYEASD